MNNRLLTVVVYGVLLTQACLLAYSATRHSPTHLEPAFLAASISHYRLGNFDLYRVNPPLPRLIPGLVMMAVGCETNWSNVTEASGSRPEFIVGDDFAKANQQRIINLTVYARWSCIPFCVLGTYIAYCWARDLYGIEAGFAALVLTCFEPNLLAHGELVTPDAACTSFGILAAYAFWKWLRDPSWIRCISCGTTLGLAILTKFTWLVLLMLWPVLWLLWLSTATRRPLDQKLEQISEVRQPPLGQLTIVLFVGVYVVNCGYAFEGTGESLDSFQFVSGVLSGCDPETRPANRFSNSVLRGVPVLLPRNLVLGVDSQLRDFEHYHEKSYLRGEWKAGGWWYYYLYGLLVKTPTGLLAMIAVSLIVKAISTIEVERIRDEFILLAPAALILIIASRQTSFGIHLRYVFPSLGLLLIFCSQVASRQVSGHMVSRALAPILIIYSVVGTLTVYPHHLAYFNEFGGGMTHGHLHLLGSSRDWGQDLIELKQWCDRNEISEIYLASFGRIHPSAVGLNAEPIVCADPTNELRPLLSRGGWFAVSDSILCGKPLVSFSGKDGRCFEYDRQTIAKLRELAPVCRVGGAIQVFYVLPEND